MMKRQTNLQSAIERGQLEEIECVLQEDVAVPENWEQLIPNNCGEREKITAMLHFYHAMQKHTLEDDYPVRATLALIAKGSEYLSQGGNFSEGILVLGQTRVGKSTLVNWLRGTEYEVRETDTGETELVPRENSLKEKTVTSAFLRSETTYPQLVYCEQENQKKALFVDMPGFRDSRGVAHEIAAGVCTQMLSLHCTSWKALILVCEDANLYAPSGLADALQSFDMLGKIIKRDPDKINNLLFILNKSEKSPSKVFARLKQILHDNQKTLSEDARFFLEHLIASNPETHCVVIKYPEGALRDNILKRIQIMRSFPSKELNLLSYHKEVRKFESLIQRLAEYRSSQSAELEKQQAYIVKVQRERIQNLLEKLQALKFLEKAYVGVVPKNLITEAQRSHGLLNAQLVLRERLISMLRRSVGYFERICPKPSYEGRIDGDTLQIIGAIKERLVVVNRFFNQLECLPEFSVRVQAEPIKNDCSDELIKEIEADNQRAQEDVGRITAKIERLTSAREPQRPHGFVNRSSTAAKKETPDLLHFALAAQSNGFQAAPSSTASEVVVKEGLRPVIASNFVRQRIEALNRQAPTVGSAVAASTSIYQRSVANSVPVSPSSVQKSRVQEPGGRPYPG